MIRISQNIKAVLAGQTIKFLLISIVILGSCKEERVKFDTKHPITDDEPEQYGIPFGNVPETSDILMYEINLQAFSAEGNIVGAQKRLDSLKNLGVNVIWLMPIYPIGEEKGVGSPYAVKDYKSVNARFGDLDILREFVTEAHNRDMAVILDWVANHTSWDNDWIQTRSWYTQDASGNILTPNESWTDVADLNFNNEAMRKEMIKAMKYWVLEANIDGYRCDYADGVPLDFWKQAIDTLRNIPERDIIMFAEGSDKNLLNSGFDMIFGWNFYFNLLESFEVSLDINSIISTNSSDYQGIPQGDHIVRWITNHDQNAWETTPEAAFNGQEGALAAYVVTSYMGGVPLMYNGQEVGCPIQLGFFSSSTEKINWNINPGILSQYKKINNFRNNSEAVKTGSLQSFNLNDKALGMLKTKNGDEVAVLVNLSSEQFTASLPVEISNKTWTNIISLEQIETTETIKLAPYEYMILD
ncbi:alpha-amylase family glycosyl hydrolase [Marinigracilibium pacificum]|uniref:Alpha-amylase n=1 Tax=Marinigracilibium pacificum TaxID=2729599 RepID=A0A848J208_9BACT|nr:alpha-amylase family glycosyl hydrolase [Marinigracilibium pacificum]NMM49535.1 alpha-amylase [Marinigracilibium pacificum]